MDTVDIVKDREPAESLYSAVATALRARITDGVLPGGHRLGSQHELAAEFSVSRETIRKAVSILEAEGLLIVRQGMGTFVRSARTGQSLERLETLDATLVEQGFEPHTEVVEYSFTRPPANVREALWLEDGQRVLYLRRLHAIEDGPIAVVDLWVPDEIGERWSRQEVENSTLYELLENANIPVQSASQVIRAVAATPDLARAVGVDEGAPALVCERVTVTEGGRPIVYAVFYYRSDRFEFRVSLRQERSRLFLAVPEEAVG